MSADWLVTSAGDVAVMMSSRADVSKRNLARDGVWRLVTARDGSWQRVKCVSFCAKSFGGAWQLR